MQGHLGNQGLTGAQGNKGGQGYLGIQGTNGTQGSLGVRGVQGYSGSQGNKGTQGFSGTQGSLGFRGVQGYSGSQGSRGVQGSLGIRGPQGALGFQGFSGSQGASGSQGSSGFSGAQGDKGLQGSRGIQGYSGSQGATGVLGPQGYLGMQGPRGIQGIPIGSLIPFSSGIIANSSVTTSPPVVMGFGSNTVVTTISSPIMFGQYAFSVPLAGFLSNLQASVDAHFAPNTAQDLLTYTFTILDSPCTGLTAPTNTYAPTLLSADATFPAVTTITYPAGQYVSTSGNNTSSIPVAQGDRIVLQITSNQGTPPAIDAIGFNGGVFYSPS